MQTFYDRGTRRVGRRFALQQTQRRRILLIAVRHHDATLARCVLAQLGGLLGAW